jgi:hypothetical protein
MCRHGTNTNVMVKVPAHLSSTGVDKWREFGIDSCIAPIGRPGQLRQRLSRPPEAAS